MCYDYRLRKSLLHIWNVSFWVPNASVCWNKTIKDVSCLHRKDLYRKRALRKELGRLSFHGYWQCFMLSVCVADHRCTAVELGSAVGAAALWPVEATGAEYDWICACERYHQSVGGDRVSVHACVVHIRLIFAADAPLTGSCLCKVTTHRDTGSEPITMGGGFVQRTLLQLIYTIKSSFE